MSDCQSSTSKPLCLYRETLTDAEKVRYDAKLVTVGGSDPYTIDVTEWSDNVTLLPHLEYPDIVNYLLLSPSPYSVKDMKQYKSLEAYQLVDDGGVSDMSSVVRNGKCIIKARVMDSLSEMLEVEIRNPWVVVEENGIVDCGHCNCTTGLQGTCTHVAALLYTVDAAIQILESTGKSYHCPVPKSLESVFYKKISDMDFGDDALEDYGDDSSEYYDDDGDDDDNDDDDDNEDDDKSEHQDQVTTPIYTPEMTDAERRKTFFQALYKSGCRPVLFTSLHPSEYMPDED